MPDILSTLNKLSPKSEVLPVSYYNDQKIRFVSLDDDGMILKYDACNKIGDHAKGEFKHAELKPCIRCGGTADIRARGGVYLFGEFCSFIEVVCTNCGHRIENEWMDGMNINVENIEAFVNVVVGKWNSITREGFEEFVHRKKETIIVKAPKGLADSCDILQGDCLEGAGIPDGAFVTSEANLQPNVGDFVLCHERVHYGSILLKKVISIDDDRIIVGTQYKDCKKDFAFVPGYIYGVATKIETKKTIYERT